jgi:hypothetical protein
LSDMLCTLFGKESCADGREPSTASFSGLLCMRLVEQCG